MSRRTLLLLLVSSALAHANGRPPFTNGIYFQPGDNQSIYVRSTFGLLISHDGGCSFRWTCEDSIGYGGTFDPQYAIAADGSIYATTYAGLHVTHDGGCTWGMALANRYVNGIDLGSNGDVWIVTSDSAVPNDVLRSVDGGATFGSAGFASTSLLMNSIKVAPSDPMTLYTTGYQLGSGAHFYTTTNAGSAWTESALAGVTYGPTPVLALAAVDPANPMIVFATSIGASPPVGDTLYRSADGGGTFAQVLTTTQPIAGVVDLDGSSVVVATGTGGAFRSSDGGMSFQPMAGTPQLLCIGKRPDGTLVGCGTNWDPDFMAVATTGDMTTWNKMFRFAELDGVVACPAGTLDHDVCDVQQWPTIAAQFGVIGPSCPSATDVPADAAAPPVKPPMTGGSCNGAGDAPIGLFALVAIALALGYKKRRQSSV